MNIIITGGAGFIGSHVVDTYIGAGHRVVVIDNLKTGHLRNINRKAKFYKADIENTKKLENIFKKERPEIVNHLAALAEVSKSLRDPLPTFKTNTLGTIHVLIAFAKFGTGKNKKFVFSSTGGAMYGETKKIPANEETTPNPLSPYGLSKLMAEDAIKFYGVAHRFPYFIFRYANVYGPRQNQRGEAGVVAIFSDLMHRNIRPTIFGDGSKTRDYVFVKDVARANLLALSKGKDATVNIGLGKEVSDKQVYDAVARAMKFEKEAHYAPFREGEIIRSALDAKNARIVLGWRPTVKFEEGVGETIASRF